VALRRSYCSAQVGGLASDGDGVGLGVNDPPALLLGARGVCRVAVLAPGLLLTLGGVGGGTDGG